MVLAAPALAEQVSELRERAPRALRSARGWLDRHGGESGKIADKAGSALGKAGEKAVPALLAVISGVTAAVSSCWASSWWCILGVHLVEGYLVQPMIMRRAVEVKPAALLIGQGTMTAIFGLPGTIVATPLLVCIKVLTDYLRVERRLGKQ